MSTDKTLTCRDCKSPFTFTAGEQTFFEERNFSEPVRCKTCRTARKQQARPEEAKPSPVPATTNPVASYRPSSGGAPSYANEDWGGGGKKPGRRMDRKKNYRYGDED